jgi:2'-5' RNA ligase
MHLRGAASFRPVSPVVFVPLVAASPTASASRARSAPGPLARELKFPYHPHVTVAHDLGEDALDRRSRA